MVKVKARATMLTFLDWVGEVPDDIPENKRWYWIRHNVDGGEYEEVGGDWEQCTDVEVIEEGGQ